MPPELPKLPKSRQELIELAIWLDYQDTIAHFEKTGEFVFNGHILTEEEMLLVQKGQPLPAHLMTPGNVVIPRQFTGFTPGKAVSPKLNQARRGRNKKGK